MWRESQSRYFSPEQVGDPELHEPAMAVFYVEIGDGRVGRAITTERAALSFGEADRVEIVCRAINRFVDRTGREEIEDHLTSVRGVYLNEYALRGEEDAGAVLQTV
jgi:hypothetical protein